MRTILFTTGLFSAITTGMSLLRALRDEPFTWRTALAWLSWGISLILAIGAIVDVRRAERGELAPFDSPVHGQEDKIQRRAAKG